MLTLGVEVIARTLMWLRLVVVHHWTLELIRIALLLAFLCVKSLISCLATDIASMLVPRAWVG